MRGTIPQEVLYRLPNVIDITGRSRAAIYRDIAAGQFPRPVQLGTQSVAWRKSDLDRWIASRPTTSRSQTDR
jgi:prophage regulatory protein